MTGEYYTFQILSFVFDILYCPRIEPSALLSRNGIIMIFIRNNSNKPKSISAEAEGNLFHSPPPAVNRLAAIELGLSSRNLPPAGGLHNCIQQRHTQCGGRATTSITSIGCDPHSTIADLKISHSQLGLSVKNSSIVKKRTIYKLEKLALGSLMYNYRTLL